ncbi:putative Histone H2A.Z-specific chaperone chz1 [Glarea lozoyensis 74030]|uniref:Putative Histone H2A.Z-specific chaperone chz1 n=1 Tax=Glarea lozoyensis (strain ATCC 74030 / MF5533) TaxID=1104152 RepID=H0ELL1_GLAL7|nr:putative Histone H2A.Z-specific chaperone chz1 [Glarea lozoyensis 74030]
MSAANGSAMQVDSSEGKGKGKAVEPTTQEVNMEEDDSSSDEDVEAAPVVEEVDDGDDEIDASNIITSGRRTRGVQIDFAKAAAETPADDEDEEDDDDFEEPVDTADEDSRMEE